MENLPLNDTLLFRGMRPEEIAASQRVLSAHKKGYVKGEVILRAGSAAAWMGMVLAGGVPIESTDLWGNRAILGHVGPGQYFAETYALLAVDAVPVDVVADADSVVLRFRISALREMDMTAEPWRMKLLTNLLTISAHKNLALSARSFHTASKHIRGRIMAYLNAISLEKRAQSFDIPFDRQQLADYLNVERTALSKELGKMKREGLIDFRRKHFILLG
ncbi:MAG: Crp/Fnr family transcriptional regulator [Oscillospiraceae bacterium]|nr:Crp/Fnr family transcriptional regulator [Oscillospiraceae bacterium]